MIYEICYYLRVAAPCGGRSGVWQSTRIRCIRNGLGRGLKFGAVSLRVGFAFWETSLAHKLRQSIPGDPRGPLLVLSWKTCMWISIANPLRNCSTASSESAGDVRLVVEEMPQNAKSLRMRGGNENQLFPQNVYKRKITQNACWKYEFAVSAKRLKTYNQLEC